MTVMQRTIDFQLSRNLRRIGHLDIPGGGQIVVEGDYAYILWTAETADNVYEMGSDTFVVRDGKIVAQSFAAKTTAKG